MSSAVSSNISPILIGRYARALFNLALEKGLVDVLYDDVTSILAVTGMNSRMAMLFNSPRFTDDDKIRFIRNCFTGKIQPMLINFMILVLQHNRIMGLVSMLKRFIELVNLHKGIWRAELVSAVPLKDERKRELDETLESFMRTYLALAASEPLNLKIDYIVDPTMIGGLRFMCGNTLLDDTIRGKLEKMRTHLMAAIRQ